MELEAEKATQEGRHNNHKSLSEFDLNTVFSSNYTLTLYELTKVVESIYSDTEDAMINYLACFSHRDKKANSNSNNSGIINKLEDQLFLDVHINDDDSPQVKFNKLRLLKCIFDIDKTKTHAQKPLSELPHRKIHILNFMIRPELSKVNNSFQGKEQPPLSDIDAVKNALTPYIEHPDEIQTEIAAIHSMWMRLFLSINGEAIKGAYEEDHLNVILNRLELILANIKPPGLQKPTEKVLDTFYLMLLKSMYTAVSEDLLKINYQYDNPPSPSQSLSIQYATDPFFDTPMTWEEFRKFFSLKGKALKTEEGRKIWSMILYQDEPTMDTMKECAAGYSFVVNNDFVKDAASLWLTNVNRKEMTVGDWIVIVQELMCIKKEKPDTPVYKKSLSASAKDIEWAPAINRMMLLNRIANRYIFLFGTAKQLDTKVKIEKCLLELEKSVFAYHDLKRIVECHRFLYFQAAVSLFSEPELAAYLKQLGGEINARLEPHHHAAVCSVHANFDKCYPCIAALALDNALADVASPELHQLNVDVIDRIAEFMSDQQIEDFDDTRLDDFLLNSNHIADVIQQKQEIKKTNCSLYTLADLIASAILQHDDRALQFSVRVPVQFSCGYTYQLSIRMQYDPIANCILICEFQIR